MSQAIASLGPAYTGAVLDYRPARRSLTLVLRPDQGCNAGRDDERKLAWAGREEGLTEVRVLVGRERTPLARHQRTCPR
jgi:hypothetical protein